MARSRLWVLGLASVLALAGLVGLSSARARRGGSFRALLEHRWNHSVLPSEPEKVFVHQGLRQKYEWHIPYATLVPTHKELLPDDMVPLDAAQAWQVAQKWLKAHGCQEPKCLSCERLCVAIGPHDLAWNFQGCLRYFYRLHCVVALSDTMDVYVLMNGTVVEPTPSPGKDEWKGG